MKRLAHSSNETKLTVTPNCDTSPRTRAAVLLSQRLWLPLQHGLPPAVKQWRGRRRLAAAAAPSAVCCRCTVTKQKWADRSHGQPSPPPSLGSIVERSAAASRRKETKKRPKRALWPFVLDELRWGFVVILSCRRICLPCWMMVKQAKIF